MLKYSKITLFLIVFLLFAVSAQALGVWDSEGETLVFAGQKVVVGTNILRITDVTQDKVSFDVEKEGRIVDSGYVSPDRPSFATENEVWVEYKRPSIYTYYGKGAYIKPYSWVNGRIGRHNFPNVMNIDALYDLTVEVENTGSKTARYRLELTQKGEFDRTSWTYILPTGEHVAKLMDAAFPSQFIIVPYEGIAEVEYKSIGPRRGPGKHELAVYRQGEILLKLFYDDVQIDEVNLGPITMDNTKSGYIKKIRAPKIMMRDMEYLVDVELVNTGYTTQGISKTFNLELLSPEFIMDPSIMRDDIQSFTTDIWSVNIRPTKIGDYELKFRFTYHKGFATDDYKILHEYSVPVKVTSGYSTYIEQINAPNEIGFGEQFKVDVNLHNYGAERSVILRLKAPDLLEKPKEKLIILDPTSTYSTSFMLDATKIGKIPLLLELIPKQMVTVPGKNYDPYTEDSYVINAKSAYVNIGNQLLPSQKEIDEEQKPDVIVKFIEPPTPQVIAPPVSKEPVRINIVTAVLLIIAVVLALALFKVVMTLKKRK